MNKYLKILLEMIVHIGKTAIVWFCAMLILEFCRSVEIYDIRGRDYYFEIGYKVVFNMITIILSIYLLKPILTFNINKLNKED